MEPDNGFYISDWQIDPPSCLISRGNTSVHLEPKVMDLLVYMSKRSDLVHSREDLLENIWQGMVVSDEALTSAIIKLRKAFKDDAHHPRYIETLPKRGYRLIAEVKQVDTQIRTDNKQKIIYSPKTKSLISTIIPLSFILILATLTGITWVQNNNIESTSNLATSTGLSLPDRPSIAVLPFINTGNEAKHSYFSDGITDDLITDLSKLSGLFVISRNSTFQYKGQTVDAKQVAKALGVRFILEGSVRRSGNRVRVNTQLIDGTSGGELWAERYDGDLQDVFAVQDQITSKIIAALALQLTEQDMSLLNNPKTTNPAAYDEFLKGWEYHWRFTREDFIQAEVHFKKALLLDPGYARAHAALALIYWQAWQQKWHMNSGSPLAGWVRGRRELNTAMLNPTPLAHSLSSAMFLYNRRYDEAISEANKAVSLNPNSATGYLALAEALAFTGQSENAIGNAKKGLRLDPNFPAQYLFVEGRAYFDLEQYDNAISTLKRVISASPGDSESLVVMLAAHGQLDQQQEAQAILEQLNQQLSSDNLPVFTLSWTKNRWPYQHKIERDRLDQGLRKAGVPEW